MKFRLVSFELLSWLLITITAPYEIIQNKCSGLADPLLMGGIGAVYYATGNNGKQRELQELKDKSSNAIYDFKIKEGELENYLSRTDTQVDYLERAVSDMEHRLGFNANAVRSTVENFVKNGLFSDDHKRLLIKSANEHFSKNSVIQLFSKEGLKPALEQFNEKEKEEQEEEEIEENVDEKADRSNTRLRLRNRSLKSLKLGKTNWHRKTRIGYD